MTSPSFPHLHLLAKLKDLLAATYRRQLSPERRVLRLRHRRQKYA